MRIYVASSCRNEKQPSVVKALRDARHKVYDFRNPKPGYTGFHWSDIDPEWKSWSPEQFRGSLEHPIAVRSYEMDFKAMLWADATVCVMPCGRSAHLELGYAIGAGKLGIVLLSDEEPELMYRLAHYLCVSTEEVIQVLAAVSRRKINRLEY